MFRRIKTKTFSIVERQNNYSNIMMNIYLKKAGKSYHVYTVTDGQKSKVYLTNHLTLKDALNRYKQLINAAQLMNSKGVLK